MYLLPAPQSINYTDQRFILRYETKIIVERYLGMKEFNYARILKNYIDEILGYSLDITKGETFQPNSIYLCINQELKPEEYELVVEDGGVVIKGGNSEGLLYGIQTLRQIITQEGAVLPGVTINDYPEILNRGFYHDVTRGRIPTLKTMKALADKMSYYKLNQLQLYVEHSFLFQDFSEVWRDDTPLTPEDILELDEYCKSINVELVPSIASFGHLHKVLSTKTYASLCELENSEKDIFSYVGRMEHHTVDVTNEDSFKMIKIMLSEFIPLFSSSQFNICADETFDLGKGKSKELADKIGTDRLYVEFLKKICGFIKEQGKRPMFWGDIIVAKPESIKELPEDVICLNWDYSTGVQDTNIKKLYDLGVTQYLCPGVHGWRRLLNRFDYGYGNISAMAKYAHQYKVEGFLNTDWGDYGHVNHPEFSTAGMIYGAAFSWNSKQISFEEINKQISILEYGDKSQRFLSIVQEIASKDNFLWESVVQYKELREKLLSEDKMDEIFSNFHLKNAFMSNENIQESMINLYEILSQLDTSKRNVVKAYLIAAKGMMLFNTLGATIGQYKHKVTNPLAKDPMSLAVDLEYWLKDYKELWRCDYKESELYRIQDVILWHADYLREI
jgi:hypothetical protein